MANWCHNLFTVSGSSHDEVLAFIESTKMLRDGEKCFSLGALIPCPFDPKSANREDLDQWCDENWGCESEAMTEDDFEWNEDGLSATIDFDSLCIPPYRWFSTVGCGHPTLTFDLNFLEIYGGLSGWMHSENGEYSEEVDPTETIYTVDDSDGWEERHPPALAENHSA